MWQSCFIYSTSIYHSKIPKILVIFDILHKNKNEQAVILSLKYTIIYNMIWFQIVGVVFEILGTRNFLNQKIHFWGLKSDF